MATNVSVSAADTLTLLDALNLITPEIARALLSDRLIPQDAPGIGFGISVFDILSLTDGLNVTTFAPSLDISDSLNLADGLAASLTYRFTVTDTITLSDSIVFSSFRSATDTLALTDAAAISVGSSISVILQSVSDTLGFFDSIQFLASKSEAAFGDSIRMADTVYVNLQSTRNSYLRRYLNDVQ